MVFTEDLSYVGHDARCWVYNSLVLASETMIPSPSQSSSFSGKETKVNDHINNGVIASGDGLQRNIKRTRRTSPYAPSPGGLSCGGDMGTGYLLRHNK